MTTDTSAFREVPSDNLIGEADGAFEIGEADGDFDGARDGISVVGGVGDDVVGADDGALDTGDWEGAADVGDSEGALLTGDFEGALLTGDLEGVQVVKRPTNGSASPIWSGATPMVAVLPMPSWPFPFNLRGAALVAHWRERRTPSTSPRPLEWHTCTSTLRKFAWQFARCPG